MTVADLQRIAVPPPAVTRKPRLPSGPSTRVEPEVVDADQRVIDRASFERDLELARQRRADRWRSRYRVIASAYGVTSNRSSAATPA